MNILCTFATHKQIKHMGNLRVVVELPADKVKAIKVIAAKEGKTIKAKYLEMIEAEIAKEN